MIQMKRGNTVVDVYPRYVAAHEREGWKKVEAPKVEKKVETKTEEKRGKK